MPKKAGEIAVTRKFIRDSGKRIGSRLTVNPRIGFLRYFRYERYERCGRHE